jgi:hypothetical protein
VHDRELLMIAASDNYDLSVCVLQFVEMTTKHYGIEYSIYHYAYVVCTLVHKHVHNANPALACMCPCGHITGIVL